MDIYTALKTLDVLKNDSYETMRRAFRTRALLNHPDKRPNDAEATKSFQRINEAWQCIQTHHGQTRPRGSAEAPTKNEAEDQLAATSRAKDALEQLRRELRQQEEASRRQQEEASRSRQKEASRRRQVEASRHQQPQHHRTDDAARTARADAVTDAQRMAHRAKRALEQLRQHLHQEQVQEPRKRDRTDESTAAQTPWATSACGAVEGQGEDEPLAQRVARARAQNALRQLQRGAAALSLQCAARRQLSRCTARRLQRLRQCEASLRCPICLEMKTVASLQTTSCAHRFCRPCLASWTVGQAQATCPICRTGLRIAKDAAALADMDAGGEETESEWEDAREYLSDADADEEHEVLEKRAPVAGDLHSSPQVSIIGKLHQHGYDKKVAAAAMFELKLPALDWTEHHLRRAVAYLELQCLS